MRTKMIKKAISLFLAMVMAVCMIPSGAIIASAADTIVGPYETVNVGGFSTGRETNLNKDWRFYMTTADCSSVTYSDSSWENLDLPHDFSITQSFSKSGNEAESGYLPGGTGWYRKKLVIPASQAGKHFEINFDGVYMHTYLYVNGTKIGENHYGYNSFAFDITDNLVCDGQTENVIAVKVVHNLPSSRWYSGSGIYRDVTLVTTDKVHVEHNGTRVSTPNIESGNGTVKNVVSVKNDSASSATVQVRATVYDANNNQVAQATSSSQSISANNSASITVQPVVSSPLLWSTESPNLYTIITEVISDGSTVDTYKDRFGFRYYTFTRATGFTLNGVKTKLNGVCMHHDQGALGSAAYVDAMRRQIIKLKDMGVNSIRATHNPYSKTFYELCDELGVMVIEEFFDGWKGPKNGNSNDFSSYFNAAMGSANSIGSTSSMSWSNFVVNEMVGRDFNRPSIIMWSLGNEIFEGYSNSADFTAEAANLRNWVTAADSTRKFTVGDNNIKNGTTCYVNVANVLGQSSQFVLGLNYTSASQNSSLYSTYSNWCLYGSETSSSTNSRGIYTSQANNSDVGGEHLTSYDTSAVGWGKTAHDSMWDILTNDFMAGEYIWTGFDYIGEPTPWNGVSTSDGQYDCTPNSSFFGIVDTAGLEKDPYYLYRAQWKAPTADDYTVHLCTSWDSDNYMLSSNKVPVWLYTNAPKVEIYRNGTLVGTANRTVNTTSAGFKYYTYTTTSNNSSYCTTSSGSGSTSLYSVFNISYSAGTLSTKAYDENGNLISESKLHGQYKVTTPGTASKLVMTRSITNDDVVADGSGLAYYEVDITDANGNLDTAATNDITFTVSGNATIAGVDSGDQATTDKFQQPSVWNNTQHTSASINAMSGKAVVIVKSNDNPGNVTVTASASGLTSASQTFTTVAPEETGGVEVADGEIASYTMVRDYTVKIGTVPSLNTDATVTIKGEASEKNAIISWDSISQDIYNTAGDYTIHGTLTYSNKELAVSANLHIVDQISVMRNVSVATAVGMPPSLPDVAAGIKSDGTTSGLFNVTWDSVNASSYAQVGTFVVNGTADYFGTRMPLTATVRVEQPTYTKNNVAPRASKLETSVSSDTPASLIDGEKPTGTTDETSKRWSNWDDRGPGKEPTITLEWDTAVSISEVNLYYYLSYGGITQAPASVRFMYSLNGQDYIEIGATAGTATEISTQYGEQTFVLDEAVSPVGFRIIPKQAENASCVAMSEIELFEYKYGDAVQKTSADLTSIYVDGIEIDNVNSEMVEYTADNFDTNSTVTAVSEDNVAVTVVPREMEDRAFIVTLSEDGQTSKLYTILSPEAEPEAIITHPYTFTFPTQIVPEATNATVTSTEGNTMKYCNWVPLSGHQDAFAMSNGAMSNSTAITGITGNNWSVSMEYNHTSYTSKGSLIGLGSGKTTSSKPYADLVYVSLNGSITIGATSDHSTYLYGSSVSDPFAASAGSRQTITLAYNNGTLTVTNKNASGVETSKAIDVSAYKADYESGAKYIFFGSNAQNYLGGDWTTAPNDLNIKDSARNMYFYSINSTVTTSGRDEEIYGDTNFSGFDNVNSTIENLVNAGKYTGNATRAADNSYTSTGLVNGDSMSSVLWTYGVGGNSSHSQTGTNGWWKAGPQFGDITFLYDGTTDMKCPISMFHGAQYQDFRGYKIKPTGCSANSTDYIELTGNWHGVKDSAGYATSTNYSILTVSNSTVAGSGMEVQATWSTQTPTKYYSNSFKLKPERLSFTENMATIESTDWGFGNVYSGSSPPSSSNQVLSKTITHSTAKIRVLNYKPIADACESVKSFYKNNVQYKENIYTPSSLQAYYTALEKFFFNPNGSFNTSSTGGNGYADCQTKLNDAIANIDKALGNELVKRKVTITYNFGNGTIKKKIYPAGTTIPTPNFGTGTVVENIADNSTQHREITYAWPNNMQRVALNNASYSEISTDSSIVKCSFAEADDSTNNNKHFECENCSNSYRVDMSAYNAALQKYEQIIATDNYKMIYTLASREDYAKAIDNAIKKITGVFTQSDVDGVLTDIETASNLVKQLYPVRFSYQIDGEETQYTTSNCEYGETFTLSLPDSVEGTVYKWVMSSSTQDVKVDTNSRTFDIVANLEKSYTCFLVSNKESESSSNTVKLSILSKSNRIGDIAYVSRGTYSVSIQDTSISVGTVSFEAQKPAFYNITGFTVNGDEISDGETIEITADTVITPIYTPMSVLTISRADINSDILINGKESYEAKWDERITLTGQNTTENTAWYFDGVLVGYGTEYSFHATKACTVSYDNSNTSKQGIARIDYFNYGEYRKKTAAVVCGYSIPDDCTIVKTGVLMKTDRTTPFDSTSNPYIGATTLTEDWWTAAVQGTNGNFTTEKQISTNQYMICVSRTADTSFIMGAVAYIVYEDSQGETHTAFSEQSLISYKTA